MTHLIMLPLNRIGYGIGYDIKSFVFPNRVGLGRKGKTVLLVHSKWGGIDNLRVRNRQYKILFITVCT